MVLPLEEVVTAAEVGLVAVVVVVPRGTANE